MVSFDPLLNDLRFAMGILYSSNSCLILSWWKWNIKALEDIKWTFQIEMNNWNKIHCFVSSSKLIKNMREFLFHFDKLNTYNWYTKSKIHIMNTNTVYWCTKVIDFYSSLFIDESYFSMISIESFYCQKLMRKCWIGENESFKCGKHKNLSKDLYIPYKN